MRYIDADKLIELANNTKDKTIDANDIFGIGVHKENYCSFGERADNG